MIVGTEEVLYNWFFLIIIIIIIIIIYNIF